MLTKNEITSLSLSPTKKDFVQIWNELLDVASKLSERWDPTSTNESDPGIVILKALAGIADKLNYNIDKNTLEAFMPTAAQEDSMRKLCDMLGYNIKYYQSATTSVNIRYYNPDPEFEELSAMRGTGLLIPKFTVITNKDQDISYFTINDRACYISAKEPVKTLLCMEGQIVKCEGINDNNIITVNQISSNNRFYLPETYIAENGIFIYNVISDPKNPEIIIEDGNAWEKTNNLNIHSRGSKVYKFGFDSYESRPYIEFPEDYSELFDEGLFIYYTRTNGVNGNISPRTLTQLELPTLAGWEAVSADSFSVENLSFTSNGSNIETIEQAYTNFKKTIGTFETIVTCRDYMNKIYSMVNEFNKPYVSNILVTDIRNDLNNAVTICSCDDAGIYYKETALLEDSNNEEIENLDTKPIFDSSTSKWYLGSSSGLALTNKTSLFGGQNDFDLTKDGLVSEKTDSEGKSFWSISQEGKNYLTVLKSRNSVSRKVPKLDHFDLVFYPFKSYSQINYNAKDSHKNIKDIYDDSFTYSTSKLELIKLNLADEATQTIAHKIITPKQGDLVSINNYLRLSANIATTSKVTSRDGEDIINNIKIALANAFNMRALNFGEEIPFDDIVKVIEKADARIKVAALNEPALYTTFSRVEKVERGVPTIVEYAVASGDLTSEKASNMDRLKKSVVKVIPTSNTPVETKESTFDTDEAKKIYNKLAVRNILAGRVPLFNYNTTFKNSFLESAYLKTSPIDIGELQALCTESEIQEPSASNPRTVWVSGDALYSGYYNETKDPAVSYYRSAAPIEFSGATFNQNAITDVRGKAIKGIETIFEIAANTNKRINNVKLSDSEYIKFRAPNFTTIKTYPAYVNYHLRRDRASLEVARSAEAHSLFELLNSDINNWSENSTDKDKIIWQEVLDYFDKSGNKKTGILTQKVDRYVEAASLVGDSCPSADNETNQHVEGDDGNCIYCGTPLVSVIQEGPIIIEIGDTSTGATEQKND